MRNHLRRVRHETASHLRRRSTVGLEQGQGREEGQPIGKKRGRAAKDARTQNARYDLTVQRTPD